MVVDGSYDTLEVRTAKGEYICSVHGDTLGIQCDRASLIAAAPQTLAEVDRIKEIARELIVIAETINKFASGPIPWGGCQCDHGEDGRCLLRGEKCGRCKALERLKEIKRQFGSNGA